MRVLEGVHPLEHTHRSINQIKFMLVIEFYRKLVV